MIHVNKLVIGASLALVASVASAHADPSDARSVVVSTRGLDLSKPVDVEKLYGRLRAAARRVCEPLESRSAAGHRDWMMCREDALARAVARVGNTELSQHHQRERGRPSAS